MELPRINYNFNGKKYRYSYMCCVDISPVATKVLTVFIFTVYLWTWPNFKLNMIHKTQTYMTLAVLVAYSARNTFLLIRTEDFFIILFYYFYFIQLVKFDAETKQQIEWTGGDCFASEPVFIPRPDAVDEDDGKLLSFIKYNLIWSLCFWPNESHSTGSHHQEKKL